MEHRNPTGDAPAQTPVSAGSDVPGYATTHDILDATPGSSTQDARGTVKPSLPVQESTDSGIDAGSSSEYDQENHGDHIIEAQESDFSDEG